MESPSNKTLSFGFKILAMLAFIAYTNQGFSDRVNYLIIDQNYSTLFVFIILWVSSILILLIVSFQPKTITRIFWGGIISITTAISFGFYSAGGSELEVLDIFELWQAKHETGRAISYYINAATQAGFMVLVGFLIIVYPPPKFSIKAIRTLHLLSWLPLLPIMIFCSLIFIKSDKAVAGLPQQFSPASMAIAITYKSAVYGTQKRNAVERTPENKPLIKHLVYLVDESINPNYLYDKFGKTHRGFADNKDKIADFGISVSGSNCSARSNAILRLGATRDNLIQSVKNNPTLWQYAKKAGFRTVYIDSQSTGIISSKPNDFQNYMSEGEAQFIDKFYKVKNVPLAQLDYKLLELIKKELANDIPTFIYANKNGAHFPYSDNYPESEAIHQPVVSNKKARGVGGLLELYKQDKGMLPVINTYKNAIHWTVDMFFRQFFDEIDLDNTAVIYTSDHGQNFQISSTTHCTSGEGAPAVEGIVPLMLMTANKNLISEFTQAAKKNFNKTDHFSIFPTVLNLFGYSKEIQNDFAPTLFDSPKDRISAFNTGDILGIISTDTMWREVSQEERAATAPNLSKKSKVSINRK